jgi:hypothetical protein
MRSLDPDLGACTAARHAHQARIRTPGVWRRVRRAVRTATVRFAGWVAATFGDHLGTTGLRALGRSGGDRGGLPRTNGVGRNLDFGFLAFSSCFKDAHISGPKNAADFRSRVFGVWLLFQRCPSRERENKNLYFKDIIYYRRNLKQDWKLLFLKGEKKALVSKHVLEFRFFGTQFRRRRNV